MPARPGPSSSTGNPAPRCVVHTDFADEIGEGIPTILPGFDGNLDRFRSKVEARIADLLTVPAVRKIHDNEPITTGDLSAVEQALIDAGIGTTDEIAAAAQEASGLGLFIRSVVGLDRRAAKAAMEEHIPTNTLAATQIQFVNLVVDYLATRGVLPAEALYEDPFTGIAPEGPDALFAETQVEETIEVLHLVRDTRGLAHSAGDGVRCEPPQRTTPRLLRIRTRMSAMNTPFKR